ncbi:MAG: BMP family ABC transporter substrate-binding protein, partial [Anaerolineales bacterium]|nr:BMP family ABC transporter substrate-binding protein [Anaerolineales bacterium]
GLYVEENVPGSELIYIDKVNPADRPGTTSVQLAGQLMEQGADLVIFNSDDMKDGALEFAQNNPDFPVIHISGDHAWEEGRNYVDQSNLANVMGNMTYGKMIAGCAAALTSQTGQIGYLGPLINDETRRLTASAYLGAEYCWENYAGNDPADLQFRVTWIGFWFNIPGVTADPTQVSNEFYNSGFDVVISGIDTTEALVQADQFASEGQDVWAVPYDFEGACEEAPEICLGVPYFNWGPDYVEEVQSVKAPPPRSHFEWNEPYWPDINDHDQSPIGYEKGPGLSDEASQMVDQFIQELADGLQLWQGPLNLQDGTTYLEEGETASTQQIWYLPQLLEGMEGQSVPEE